MDLWGQSRVFYSSPDDIPPTFSFSAFTELLSGFHTLDDRHWVFCFSKLILQGSQ